MKILLIMDPYIPIPPTGYGGHERLVYMFAQEYHRLGHEVDLLVGPGSRVEGCAIIEFGKNGFPPTKENVLKAIPEAWKFLWTNRKKYDLVHNFGRLVYLLPILNSKVKKIMTYGREISKRNIDILNKLPAKNLVYTGCSKDLIKRAKASGNWKAVYNAIPFKNYQLQEEVSADAPLIFLGRLERVKGCHTAIKIAKETGNKLIIAGNVSQLPEEQAYFEKEIVPYIDGEQITYVGHVDDDQKNYYLGISKALLFPIEWNEPFGMVMAEAMACGTPVIGFRRGSVPEVVDEGITGFIVNDNCDTSQAIDRLADIDRRTCREKAKSIFDVSVIAKSYLSLFE